MSRISPGTVIVGIFAVLFGLVGAYAVRKSLQRPEQQVEAPQVNVVPVASVDLVPGRTLSVGDIALLRLTAEQIRERGLPEGYMTNSQQIIGRVLRGPLEQGQPFMTTDLYPEGMGPSVAERLKPGLRAVTVPIANTAAVAGMATPGSYVDVLFRTDTSFGGEELAQTTITLLESVEVLAFGQNILPGTRPPDRPQRQDNVTLAVSPEQAAALKVVEGRGDLMLTLRGPEDLEYISDPQPLTMDSLLGLTPGPPPVTTEIYRGTSKETMSFLAQEQPPARITARPIRPGFVPSRKTSQPVDEQPTTRPAVLPAVPPPAIPASGPPQLQGTTDGSQPASPAAESAVEAESSDVQPVPPPLTSQTPAPKPQVGPRPPAQEPGLTARRPAASTTDRSSTRTPARAGEVAASRWAIPGSSTGNSDSASAARLADTGRESPVPTASELEPAPARAAPSKPAENDPAVSQSQAADDQPAGGAEPAKVGDNRGENATQNRGTTQVARPAAANAVAQRRFVTEVFTGNRTSHRVFQDGQLVEELEGKSGSQADESEGDASAPQPVDSP